MIAFDVAVIVGGAIAELIVHGEYRTIDLARFGYARVVASAPYSERGIV